MNFLPDLILDLWSGLLLLGSLHGWFLCLVLILTFRGYNTPRVILASLIFVLSYYLFNSFLWRAGLIVHFPHLLATATPVLFLAGPLYYWFFNSTLAQKNKISWIHFAPALICLLTIIPFYAKGLAFKLEYIHSKDLSVVSLPPTRAIYYGFLYLQLFFYWVLSLRLLYQPLIDPDGRKTKRFKSVRNWLNGFHYAFGIFMVIYLGSYLILTLTQFNYGEILYVAQLSLALLVHAIGYFTLKESTLFRDYHPKKLEVKKSGNEQEIKQKILDLMTGEKPFLNQDLTLPEFSRMLFLSPVIVSRVINQEFQSNFSDFVNKYRVEEAKKLLMDQRYNHYKVEAIGQEAGFNNKVNFNRVFKKCTGMSPSKLKYS